MNRSLENITETIAQRLRGSGRTLALAGGLGLASVAAYGCDDITDVEGPCDGPGCVQQLPGDTIVTPPDTIINEIAEYALAIPVVNDTLQLERLAPCEGNEVDIALVYNGGIPGVTSVSARLEQEDRCFYIFPADQVIAPPIGQALKLEIHDVQGTDPEAIDGLLGEIILTTMYPKEGSGEGTYLIGMPNTADHFEINIADNSVNRGAVYDAFNNGQLELQVTMYGQTFSSRTSRFATAIVPNDAHTIGTEVIEPLLNPYFVERVFDCDAAPYNGDNAACLADYELAKAEVFGE